MSKLDIAMLVGYLTLIAANRPDTLWEVGVYLKVLEAGEEASVRSKGD